jgi:hypothetical protein
MGRYTPLGVSCASRCSLVQFAAVNRRSDRMLDCNSSSHDYRSLVLYKGHRCASQFRPGSNPYAAGITGIDDTDINCRLGCSRE